MYFAEKDMGVPILVVYHVETEKPLLNEETANHVKTIISQKGTDAWWYMKVDELLPEAYCDNMDVWFDSGSSWASVLEKRSGLSFPADLYLEGTDQHRGWFQSSLLASIDTKGNKF